MVRTPKEIMSLINDTQNYIHRSVVSLMHPEFSDADIMYPYATENLNGVTTKQNLTDKKVLTVTGSGDHLLNFALSGAKEIDCFDLNKNAYYITQLKIGALKSLSYQEYLTYFSACEETKIIDGFVAKEQQININPNMLSVELYKRIRPNLTPDVCFYWDQTYKLYNLDTNKMKQELFFGGNKRDAVSNNKYLANENNYNKLKSIIGEVKTNFYDMNILDLHKLPDKYDYVYLSNIYTYLVDKSDIHNYALNPEDFNKYVRDDLSNILNEDGKVAIYQYGYKTRNHYYKNIIDKIFKTRFVIKQNPDLDALAPHKLMVSSYIEEYKKAKEKDAVYIYEGKSR